MRISFALVRRSRRSCSRAASLGRSAGTAALAAVILTGPDARARRRHGRDPQVLERQERAGDREVDDVLGAPAGGLHRHGRVAGERPQHLEAMVELGPAADAARDDVVVPQQGVVAQQEHRPRVRAGRQSVRGCPLGRNCTSSSGTKQTSCTSSTALETPKCRSTCQYCIVSAWLWLWLVITLVIDLAPLARRRQPDAGAARAPPGRGLPAEVRVEVLRAVRDVVAARGLPGRRRARRGRVGVPAGDAEAGDDAREHGADAEARAEAAGLRAGLHPAAAAGRLVERGLGTRRWSSCRPARCSVCCSSAVIDSWSRTDSVSRSSEIAIRCCSPGASGSE